MHRVSPSMGPTRSTARLALLGAAAFAFAVALAAACSSSRNVPCSSGEIQTCTCASGAMGTQSCDSNGSFTACSCPADGGVDGAKADAGIHDAGASDAAMHDVGMVEVPDGELAYMAVCTEAGVPACDPSACEPNCDSGTAPDSASPDFCFDFPNRGHYCTHACTNGDQCPSPSTGCNGMGVCKAPGANGMGEGGADE